MRVRVTVITLSAMLLSIAGCGGADGPTRHPVKGTVKYKGEPVGSGTILFGPVDPSKGTPDSATITNGDYVVTKGLGVGEYVVTVEAYKVSPKEADAKKSGSPPDNTGVPSKYGTAKTSDLKATIVEGEQTKDFDLTD